MTVPVPVVLMFIAGGVFIGISLTITSLGLWLWWVTRSERVRDDGAIARRYQQNRFGRTS